MRGQVRSARRPGEAPTLANTWLARLRARAPPLALALDDALLALLEQGRALAPPLDPTPSPTLGPSAAADGLATGLDTAGARGPHAGDSRPVIDRQAVTPAPDGLGGAPREWDSGSTLTGGIGIEQAVAGPHERDSGRDAAASTAIIAAAATAAVAADAAGAAAVRLWVEALELGPLQLLLDVHVSGGSAVLPLALDTSRCALALTRGSACVHTVGPRAPSGAAGPALSLQSSLAKVEVRIQRLNQPQAGTAGRSALPQLTEHSKLPGASV